MARFTREQLLKELERLSRQTITLVLTTNATNYVSFAPGRTPLRVRLQKAFLYAPDDVVVALGRWLGGRERTCPRAVRRFIEAPPAEAAVLVNTRRQRLQPHGRQYDLTALLARVNETYFKGLIASRITWGRRGRRRAVQARTLGAYYRNRDLIVINPVLDQAAVPEWFVAFTIYHEGLHALQVPGVRPHNRQFAQALRQHADYGAAVRWERANLKLLTRRYQPHELQTQAAAYRLGEPHEAKGPAGQLGFGW